MCVIRVNRASLLCFCNQVCLSCCKECNSKWKKNSRQNSLSHTALRFSDQRLFSSSFYMKLIICLIIYFFCHERSQAESMTRTNEKCFHISNSITNPSGKILYFFLFFDSTISSLQNLFDTFFTML